MIFQSLDIAKLVTFKFAQIDRLELVFTSPVSIILGTNGAGKSSLLRELSPLPTPRSYFEVGGHKKLTLSHRGHTYTLASDYANKTSPHSFQKDDVELNAGGTTQVQEELVVSELGYTDDVAALVTGTHDFAKMPAGLRRTLLINLNPCQLGFVLDYHKQVTSRIRFCKSNLVMLQERKFLLEQDFLPVPEQDLLRQERQVLQREISSIIEFLHRTDERLQRVSKTVTRPDIPAVVDWKNQVRLVLRGMHLFGRYRDVPRDGHVAYERQIMHTLSLYEGRLVILHEQLRELMDLRNSEHALLTELDAAEMSLQAQLRNQTRVSELSDLKTLACGNPASLETLELWKDLGPSLEAACLEFLDCATKLRTVAELQKHRQIFLHWQYIFQENQLEMTRLVQEVVRIKSVQKLRLEDIPDAPCAKLKCPLYATFRSAYDRRVAELSDLLHRQNTIHKRNDRLQRYLQARDAFLKQQFILSPKISNIEHHFTQLGESIPPKLTNTLHQDPLALYRQLTERMAISDATHRYRALQSEVDQDQWKDQAQRQIAADEKERLRLRVMGLDQKYKLLLQRIAVGDEKIIALKEQSALLQEYQSLLGGLQDQHQTLLQQLHHAWLYHDKQQLQKIGTALTTHRDRAIRRLGEIDHVLQAQTQLQSRYDEEIILQLRKIELDKLDWQWMEASLAKIPVNYTVTFLNSIIGAMNQYIAKVFSYPFFLLPVSHEQTLDYRFPVQAGDVTIPDISVCSDAQREIINLVFRLAVMKQLDLGDYPIHLDEIGKTFDTYHKRQLLDLVRDILDNHSVSQMHLVNHHAEIHEGLTNADILVLNDANILVPAKYNEHAVFNRTE